MSSIVVETDGKPVTLAGAAKALGKVDGPQVSLRADREGGPEVAVQGRRQAWAGGTEGPASDPELDCPAFRARTVEEIREYEHLIGCAADLIALAGLLADA
jgi:hypothetical protein